MPINLESHIPRVLGEYLATEIAGIEFREGYNSSEIARPFVLLYCDQFEMLHRNIMVLTVTVKLLGNSDDNKADEDARVASIRRALTDIKAIDTYFHSLDSAARAGWTMNKIRIEGGSSEVDPAGSTRDRITTLKVTARSGETSI